MEETESQGAQSDQLGKRQFETLPKSSPSLSIARSLVIVACLPMRGVTQGKFEADNCSTRGEGAEFDGSWANHGVKEVGGLMHAMECDAGFASGRSAVPLRKGSRNEAEVVSCLDA